MAATLVGVVAVLGALVVPVRTSAGASRLPALVTDTTTSDPGATTTVLPVTTTVLPVTTTVLPATTTVLPATTTTTRPPATTTTRPTGTTVPAINYWPDVAPKPFVGSSSAPGVGAFGDSLLVDIASSLTTGIVNRSFKASVTAMPGYATYRTQYTADQLVKASPRILVIATGTNDLRDWSTGYRTLDQIRTSVRTMLDHTKTVPCVAWIGVNTTNGVWTTPGSIGDHTVGGPTLNSVITDEIARSARDKSRLIYGDWSAASQGHLEYFKAPGDPHLSATGSAAYQRLILDQVDACQRALTGPDGLYPVVDRTTTQPRLDVQSSTLVATGNTHAYYDLTSASQVLIKPGDRLVYDVQWFTKAARIAVDLLTTTSVSLRDAGAYDQNNLNAHPNTLLDAYAAGQWYKRSILLPASFQNQTVNRFLVAVEADNVNADGAVRNVRIESSTGATKFVIYGSGDPKPVLSFNTQGTTAQFIPVAAG